MAEGQSQTLLRDTPSADPQGDAANVVQFDGDLLSRVVRDRLVAVAGKKSPAVGRGLRAAHCRDVLPLGDGTRNRGILGIYSLFRALPANNCSAAFLSGIIALALVARGMFQNFEIVLLPCDSALLFGAPGIVRYFLRKRLRYLGTVRIAGIRGPVLAFQNLLNVSRKRTRIYAPAHWDESTLLQAISAGGGVILEPEQAANKHQALDVLADGKCADAIEEMLASEAGTLAINLYTGDGSGARTYKEVSYFPPQMAKEILDHSEMTSEHVRIPSAHWRFVSFAYRMLFHKSAPIRPGCETIAEAFQSGDEAAQLRERALAAGAPVPVTFSDIEDLLRAHDANPEIDTISFLCRDNEFLRARYGARRTALEPGLGAFIVRDFRGSAEFVDHVRAALQERNFEILFEQAIDPNSDQLAVSRIRGGNWISKTSESGKALPVYAFICFDPAPLKPEWRQLKNYPALDNRRMLVKGKLREVGSPGAGERSCLHSSDNSAEAAGYAAALGAENHPAVRECIARLTRG